MSKAPTSAAHVARVADDIATLQRHGALEIASLRAAVQHELQRACKALHQHSDANEMLDTLMRVVDSVVSNGAQHFISFHILLLQRVATQTVSPAATLIDRVAIADRAALLQVLCAPFDAQGAHECSHESYLSRFISMHAMVLGSPSTRAEDSARGGWSDKRHISLKWVRQTHQQVSWIHKRALVSQQ